MNIDARVSRVLGLDSPSQRNTAAVDLHRELKRALERLEVEAFGLDKPEQRPTREVEFARALEDYKAAKRSGDTERMDQIAREAFGIERQGWSWHRWCLKVVAWADRTSCIA
jgi:hypothetical protein